MTLVQCQLKEEEEEEREENLTISHEPVLASDRLGLVSSFGSVYTVSVINQSIVYT